MPQKRSCANSFLNENEKVLKRRKLSVKRQQQDVAFAMLLNLIKNNNGVLHPHYVRRVTDCHDVTRKALYYRLKCHRRNEIRSDTGRVQPEVVSDSINHNDPVVIPVPEFINCDTNSVQTEVSSMTSYDDYDDTSINTASRKQKLLDGMEYALLVKEAKTAAATQFSLAQQNTSGKVQAGTLAKIITDLETEHGLEPGTIKQGTIRSRIKRNNVTGTSPLEQIEPILVELCIQMSQMGMAFNKQTVINLAADLLIGTDNAKKFSQLVGMPLPRNVNDLVVVPGNHWYSAFRKKNNIK